MLTKKPNFSRFLFLLVCFFISAHLHAQADLSQRLDFKVDGESLESALLRLSKSSGIAIGFKGALFEKIKQPVWYQAHQEKLSVILNQLLAATDLKWNLSNGQIVIAAKSLNARVLSGYVEITGSKERLKGAMVVETHTGKKVFSNEEGYFKLKVPPNIAPRLSCSMQGYETTSMHLPGGQTSMQVTISLTPTLEQGTIPSDSLQRPSTMLYGYADHIPYEKMPALAGETDIQHTLNNLLPGFSAGPNNFGRFSARGGDVDQNCLLTDGLPVFSPGHVLGMFSVLPPDLVASAVINNGDPASSLGQFTGSMLNVDTREAGDRPAVRAAIGWAAARAAVELPLIRNKSALLVSARRSLMYNWVHRISRSNKLNNGKLGISDYKFSDIFLKLHHFEGKKDSLYVIALYATDAYEDQDSMQSTPPGGINWLGTSSKYNWNTLTAGVRWNHQWNERLHTQTLLYTARFNTLSDTRHTFADTSHVWDEYLNSRSRYREITLKTDVHIRASSQRQWETGYAVSWQSITPFFIRQNVPISPTEFDSIASDQVFSTALHAGHSWRSARLGTYLYTGLRSEWYSAADGGMRWRLLPRIRLDKSIAPHLSWSFTYTGMAQALRSVTPGAIETSKEFWLLPTSHNPLQEALLVTSGPTWSTSNCSIQARYFYKKMTGVDDYFSPDGADTLAYVNRRQHWEKWVNFGQGESFGAELSASWQTAATRTWASYTWSRSTRQFEALNKGVPYPARFDRRHQIKVGALWQASPRFSLSANWWAASGDAISSLQFSGNMGDIRYLEFQALAAAAHRTGFGDLRQAWQHQLELAGFWEWKRKNTVHQVSIGVVNAYNRRNPYTSFQVASASGVAELRTLKGFSIIPNLNWSIRPG
ncbi:MAG: TonB-dependent receptor [Saprospiraceae bacterium]|nr:TonB-dependent receptor [Saprospiraceae bacterium]